jgi:DDE superfamily endonuclease
LTRIWARRGTRPRAPRDRHYQWAYLFGAVCPARAATAALVLPEANAQAMSLHLALIAKQVAPGSHAVLLFDGAGYHSAAVLNVPANITPIALPPAAPELNSAENIWEYLRANKLSNTVFSSYEDILDHACEAWQYFATDPERITSLTTRTWAQVNV